MAKQTINVGTTANDKKGDSLRAAFQKVNANFTELYTALGLNSDGTLNLGAFEFSGSTMSTADSTAITIDQSVTVSSDLTVGGDILPSIANGGNLGSLAKPFKSLYVSNNTVFLGGVPLSLDAGTNELKINNVPISQTLTYTDIPNVPTDIADLSDTGNLLGSGATGDITFAATTISAPNQDEIVIQSKDSNGFGTARVTLNSEYDGDARLRAFSSETVRTFTLANGDFATGVWQNNGFGNGVVAFTGAQNLGDFFQNTLQNLTADNVSIVINSEPAFIWNGGTSGSGTDTPGFGTNPIVPPTPITITSIQFRYRSESFISVNYNNQEIRLNAQNAGIRMDSSNTFQVFGDSRIELQSTTGMSLSAGENIELGTSSSYAVNISTGDFTVNAFDDIRIEGRDSFRLINSSATAPIRIITNDDATPRTWAFNPNGTITFPDATVQTTAYTGPQTSLTGDVKGSVFADDSTLLVDAVNGSIPYAVLSGAPSIPADVSDLTDTQGLLSTGDITFDGVKIQGSGTASGDGLGYATMELVPDTNLYANGQYIVVDPTGGEPGHIHLRAGGTQDASTADLYLGGELTCVRVSDTSGHVTIRTTNVGDPNITLDWRFETDGNLYFPGIGNNRIGESEPGLVVSSDNSVVLQSNNNGESAEWLFGTDGSLTFPDASVQTTAYTGTANLAIVARNIESEGDVSIRINLTDSTTHTWRFGEDGDLNLPSGGGNIQSDGVIQLITGGSTVTVTDNVFGFTNNVNGTIAFSMISGSMNFSGTGNFGFVGLGQFSASVTNDINLSSGSRIILNSPRTEIQGNTVDIRSEDGVNIDINLSDSTLRRWRFGEDGKLTFPDGANYAGQTVTMPTTPNGVTNSFVWEFSDQVIGSDRITLNWNLLASDTDSFYLGTTHSTTGKYLILEGNSQSLSYVANGVPTNSKIIFGAPAGNNAGDANAIELKATNGDVYLTSTESVKITVDADDSSARVWTFDPTGVLSLPAGGDIVDSTGASVLGGGGGGSVLEETFESKTSATGVVTHDATTNRLFYHTSISASFTANFTNLGLAAGEATSISLVLVQGVTARMVTAVQIGGAAQTITWQGSASAPSGNANRTDVVTFSILCTATDTYTVLGMLTSFGG